MINYTKHNESNYSSTIQQNTKLMKTRITTLILLLIASITLSAQTLTFKVQTVTFNGNYGPVHVQAVWITDANGKFVKTVDVRATIRIGFLSNWITATPNKNTVDASTGASLLTHPTSPVTFTWNCKDVNKAVVPDGNYFINIEFNENVFAGRLAKYPFKLGPASEGTFADLPNFISASYSITESAQTAGLADVKIGSEFKIAYAASSKTIIIDHERASSEPLEIQIFDLTGKQLIHLTKSGSPLIIRACNLPKGFCVLNVRTNRGFIQFKKIFIQ